jgi:hypothetical protein
VRPQARLRFRPVDHFRAYVVRREEDVAEEVEVTVDQRDRQTVGHARVELLDPGVENVVEH